MNSELRSTLGIPAQEMKVQAPGAPKDHHQDLHHMVTEPTACPTIEETAPSNEDVKAAAPEIAGPAEVKAGKPNVPVTMVTGSPLAESTEEPQARPTNEQPPAKDHQSSSATATGPTSPSVTSPAVVAEPPKDPKSIDKPASVRETEAPKGPVVEAPGATPIPVSEGNIRQLRQDALSQAMQYSHPTESKSAPERGSGEPSFAEMPAGATVAGA